MRNKKGRFYQPFLLFSYVRKQRHKSGLLYGSSKLPLMLCANMRVTRVDDLCLARNKPAQKVDFFIVDIF
jgi:hypothetical protein